MKRMLAVIAVVVLLAPIVAAQAPSFGVGAFGGLDIPVLQDDQGQGTIFGLRGRIRVLPIVTIEPNVSFTKWGDPELGIAGVTNDLDGSKVTFYGVDGTLGAPLAGPGFRVFAIGGIGFYKVKRDQTGEDDTDLGYSGGVGFGLGLSPLIGIDLRGKFHVVPIDGGGSRKSVSAVLGLNYAFGH